MKAALWGWSDANFLVIHGTEKNMTDPKGSQAIDLVHDLQRNEEERADDVVHCWSPH